ncbi:MAG: glycosyltransferase family 39 protein [Lachnospiraceae bacterium]|nr:glycosyltransferase family 39 protein [Lachnospiraceae bacterium]
MKKISISREKLLACIIILLAAVLRLHALGSLPNGLQQDEAFSLWNAWSLLNEGTDSTGKIWPVYLATWGDGQSALYSWLIIPLLALTGGEPTFVVGRIPQAVVGIITVWLAMKVCAKLFGERMGLWTGFLLAICPWHIMMCRWGLDANIAPGMLIIAFYFFVQGLEDEKKFLLSALFYGLSLYGYAVIWIAVPFMLLFQIIYGIAKKKVRVSRYTMGSVLILFLLALPLMLFVIVNAGLIEEIRLPFLTIPRMVGYRSSELAISLAQIRDNLYSVYHLLRFQKQGNPYDILLPYGMFYDIGRIFILVGVFCLLGKAVYGLKKREIGHEWLIITQLIGAGIVCMFVNTRVHQTNILYIPLVMFQAYGVECLLKLVADKIAWEKAVAVLSGILVTVYSLNLIAFQKDYYTDYSETLNAYFAEGVKESLEYVMEVNEEEKDVIIDRGAQWPRMLLFTKTRAKDYLADVVYKENGVEPYRFVSKGVTYFNGIDVENIDKSAYYVLYYNIKEYFEQDFELIAFADWYVAVPKE